MKTLLYSAPIAMLCFTISCKESPTPGSISTNSSQNEKNMAANRLFFKVFETGDISDVKSLILNDAVDHYPLYGMDVKGSDSILNSYADFHNHIKNLKVEVIADAANEDYVIALAHVTGTATDSMMGGAGAKIDEKGVDVTRYKDGKMAEHWGFVVKENKLPQ
jgi:predicted SnoaL-like aldol condensation-catalyzing enzyme